nr:hypothetical protein [uncultured Campylobacter sp.]
MSISDVVDIRKLIDTEPLEYLRALRENQANYKEIVLEEIKKREDYKNALIKEFLNNLGELALYKQELSNIEMNESKGEN